MCTFCAKTKIHSNWLNVSHTNNLMSRHVYTFFLAIFSTRPRIMTIVFFFFGIQFNFIVCVLNYNIYIHNSE